MKYAIGLITVFSVAMVAFLLLMLYVVVTSPTCKERGGVEIADGVRIQNVMIGKAMIPQVIPKYKCIISSK